MMVPRPPPDPAAAYNLTTSVRGRGRRSEGMTGEAATCDSCDTHPHLASMVSHAAAAPPPPPASMVSHSVAETEASATVELVSDDEDAEDYGEAAGVVYSCTLGDNQPLVIQAVTSDEAETKGDPMDTSDIDPEPHNDDLITNTNDDNDDIVAEPISSKFVVNFIKEDPTEEKKNETNKPDMQEDRRVESSDAAQEHNAEKNTEQSSDTETKANITDGDGKDKVSTKSKLYNLFFGCLGKRNKSRS